MEIGILCEQALTRSFQEENNNCVIDYRSKFKTLWSDSFKVDNHIARLFIVWDGVPADERAGRLAPYLTALDWILAFSLKLTCECKEGKAVNVDFTIHLIDFTSDQFENSFTSDNAPTLLEAMPWVTLYAPLKRGRSAYSELPTPADITTGKGWAEKKTLAAAAKDPGLSLRLERLADMWQAWLVRSDDHHDVNNTAGPLRLCQKKTDIKDPSPLQTALATRLDWVYGNLSHDQTTKLKNRLKGDVQRTKSKLRGQNINLVLIDDMCDDGWDELFKQWSGIGKDYLTTISKPKDILKVIEKWETINFRKRNFKFHLFPHDKSDHQVIFLDLRLHGNPANRADNETKEKGFFTELLRLIDKWNLTAENNRFAWQPISKNDFDHAKGWLDGTEPRPPEVHSLLPRVMALRAPHIPIIILSSTRKRNIIEPLKPYGNIFTALEKPQVIGSDESTLERFHSNWQEAWKHAALLLKTNEHIKTIEELNFDIGEKIPKVNDLPENPYVEIYIDETGDKSSDFAVGGVVAVYNNDPSLTLPPYEEFDDVLYAEGVSYYAPLLVPRANQPITIKEKKTLCNVEMTTVLDKKIPCVPRIFTFRLGYDKKIRHPLKDIGDSMYFLLAIKSLEGLLYESLRTYLRDKYFEVSIYMATRRIDLHKETLTWPLMKRFGYLHPHGWKKRGNEKKLECVSSNSAQPMLSPLLGERATVFKLDRALAVVLKYENPLYGRSPDYPCKFYCRKCGCYVTANTDEVKTELRKINIDPKEHKTLTNERIMKSPASSIGTIPVACSHHWVPDYRALHYLADEVLDKSKLPIYEAAGITIDEIPGFSDTNDYILQELLQASRVAEKGDPARVAKKGNPALALITAISVLSRETTLPDKSLKGIILGRLARCLPNLSGDEYLKVAKATHTT